MYTPIQFTMIENIVAYGISTMFFQIIQINNIVQLLKIIKNKNSPTNPLKQIEYLCWVIQFGHQWSQPQFEQDMFYYSLLAYRDCQGWQFLPDPRIPSPTLMGRVLPGLIRNRVGYGFLKKKKPETGPGFIKKTQTRPETRPV